MHKSEGVLYLDWKQLNIHKKTALRIIRLGVPIGIQGAMFNIANVVVQSAINSFGADAIAGHAAADSIGGFIYIVTHCIGQTTTTFTGQNYGAGNMERVKKTVWLSLTFTCVIAAAMSALGYIFGEELIRIYSPENPNAVGFGMICVFWVNCFYMIYGILEVFSGGVRGMGVAFTPMLVSVIGICGVRICWVYTVFRVMKTLPSLYMAYPASWFLTAVSFFAVYRIVLRKKQNCIK